eukprot:3196788-Pyramimonas_sp.AAC.2
MPKESGRLLSVRMAISPSLPRTTLNAQMAVDEEGERESRRGRTRINIGAGRLMGEGGGARKSLG